MHKSRQSIDEQQRQTMEEQPKYKRIQKLAETGKMQPQAVDIEEIILGAVMIEQDAIRKVIEILTPKCFYKEQHERIYDAILALSNNNDPIDISTVCNQLKKTEQLEFVGGAYYVVQLTNRVAGSANIEFHCRIIKEKYLLRKIISIASNAEAEAYNDSTDCFDLIARLTSELNHIQDQNSSSITHISEEVRNVVDIIDHNTRYDNIITGIPTGFTLLDQHTNGFQDGNLIILAGETSNGKTSMGLCCAYNSAVQYGKRIGIWSLEMSKVELASRLMALKTGVPPKKMLQSRLNDNDIMKINNNIQQLLEAGIYLDDCRSSSLNYLENSIKSAVNKYKLNYIIIDYLQLISNTKQGKSTNDEVADIANSLKRLAKFLQIPIILVSQLKRDQNGKWKPSLGRLKGSGDIENAADVVIFVSQPLLYKQNEVEISSTMYSTEQLAICEIAKGRNIGLTEFPLTFINWLTKFQDYDDNNKFISISDDNPF